MDFEKFHFPYLQERLVWHTFLNIASTAKLQWKPWTPHEVVGLCFYNSDSDVDEWLGLIMYAGNWSRTKPQQWGRMVGPQGQQSQLERSHAEKWAWKEYWDLSKEEEMRAAPQSCRIQLLTKLWSICKGEAFWYSPTPECLNMQPQFSIFTSFLVQEQEKYVMWLCCIKHVRISKSTRV